MSKIEELIEELCPNGVEFKKIKEVCDGHYGKGNNIPKDGGIYNVYGCNGIVSKTSTYNSENAPIVGHIGSAGLVTWGEGKHFVTYNGTICTPKLDLINSKYLYHNLVCSHLERYVKGSQPFLSFSDFENVKIPVPPLEVQREIVRILDDFTLLTAELTAELTARQKQYEYYKLNLINSIQNNNKFENKEIKECFKRLKGTNITAGKMKEISNLNGNIKIFAGGKTMIVANEEDIPNANITKVPAVLVQSRGIIDFIYYEKPFTFKNEMWAYTCDNQITLKYLYYVLKSNISYFRTASIGMGAMPQISLGVTEKFKIRIPPLEEQQRIVNILDRFDKLCNDISEGLPAEIEARKKQYEYYRDKLLTFKELK